MKEMVNRILNGEDVDIAGDRADYFLTVSQYGENYKIGFTYPDNMKSFHSSISLKSMREAGNLLIDLAEELESRTKFRDGDYLYFVRPNKDIFYVVFSTSSSFDLSLLAMGNAFKSREEAEAHKEEILAKYQELKDKGLV